MKRVLPFAKLGFKNFLTKNPNCNNIAQNFIRKNEALPLYIRQKSILVVNKLFNKNNESKLTYVCIFTGKSKAINVNYKVSNLTFKMLSKRALFSGFKI